MLDDWHHRIHIEAQHWLQLVRGRALSCSFSLWLSVKEFVVHILYKSGGCTVQHDTQIVNYIYKVQDDEPFEFKSTRTKIASIRGGASKKLRDKVNSSQAVLAFCRALSLNLHSLQPTQSANLANNNLGSRYRKEQKYGFGKSEKLLSYNRSTLKAGIPKDCRKQQTTIQETEAKAQASNSQNLKSLQYKCAF